MLGCHFRDQGNLPLDVPEPPKIVFEQPAQANCSDAARAEEAFRAALAPSTAPGPAWIVTMRVSRDAGELHASGEITDRAGAPVAHRTIDRRGSECAGLARAIGVWASLVLDAEVQRALEQAPVPAPPPPPPPQAGWPEPAPAPEKPSPESQLFLAHPKEERNVEVGVSSLAMGGTSNGMIAGGSLFEVSEVGAAWIPATLDRDGQPRSPQTAGAVTLGAGRFDACKRIPGNYLDQRGLQLDLCAGPEIGFLYVSSLTSGAPAQTLPFVGIGPSIDFRGELGSALSVVVRGVADLVLPETTTDGAISESPLVARAEVGLSWRLR